MEFGIITWRLKTRNNHELGKEYELEVAIRSNHNKISFPGLPPEDCGKGNIPYLSGNMDERSRKAKQ